VLGDRGIEGYMGIHNYQRWNLVMVLGVYPLTIVKRRIKKHRRPLRI